MVELEDDRVGLATVDAWVVAEVGHEEYEALFKQSLLPSRRCVDVALFVGLIVLPVIGRLAWAAVGVSLSSLTSMPGEFLVRLLRFAARAPSYRTDHTK